ncbi:hypothetical protein GGS20DRAFT_150044 [Poronia punctata]|nr:hypothetical protein GGS20DRAFT_150044 [Poronia punctata]
MESAPLSGYHTTFRAQPSEGGQRKIQKRNRPPVSCLMCRTRKVKCDRQQPCERCVKSGEANYCEYAPRAVRKLRNTEPQTLPEVRKGSEASARQKLQDRLQQLEAMVNGLVHSGGIPGQPQMASSASNSGTHSETDNRSDLSSPMSMSASFSAPSISGPNLGVPNVALHGTARTAEGNYVGGTHWATILQSIHDIQGIVEAEPDVPPSPSPPSSGHSWPADSPDLIFGKTEKLTHEQAVARLPPQHQANRLIFLYFKHRFITAPYIHTTKFQREYDSFWRDPKSVSLLWISCLASILWVASSIALEKGESGLSDGTHPDQFSALAVDCLISGEYLSAKPYSIEALLLHGFTELRKKHLVDSSLWAKFGLTARLAQRMGYHRDPRYLSNVTPFQGEIRRRAWFFIEVFDVLFSFQQGVPPIIRDDECDTESPANLYDTDFDEDMMALPPGRPNTEPTSTLYLCFKSKLCRILRRVLRQALSIQTTPYEEVIRLNKELNQYHSQIPAPLQIKPIRSYSFTDQAHDIMHRLALELMYLKSLCVLHRPYLNRDKDNPRYDMSRSICRDAALKILDLHAEYDEETKTGGRLCEDKYMLSSLTMHDFLIASMILCLDLTENVPISTADRSRKLKALGTSYKIWSERKATSNEAAHATRVVGAILKKVSLHETPLAKPPPPPPPPPPHPDVRGSSLAILLNDDARDIQPPLAPRPMPIVYDQSPHVPTIDFQLGGYIDASPLDSALKDPNMIDWSIIDGILLDRPENTYRPTM